MKLVSYEPGELWDLFIEKKDYLKTHTIIIAENPEIDSTVFLTAEMIDGEYYPSVTVWFEDAEVYSETVDNMLDLKEAAEDIYESYLSDDFMTQRYFATVDKEDEINDQQDAIDQRECELYDAAADFLEVICNAKLSKIVSYSEADDICEDIVNRVCEHLYTEYNISVFRPMMLEDENGEEFYEKFPYDCLTFDD